MSHVVEIRLLNWWIGKGSQQRNIKSLKSDLRNFRSICPVSDKFSTKLGVKAIEEFALWLLQMKGLSHQSFRVL